MTRLFRQLFRPNGSNRRLLSGVCGAFLLGSLLFSSLFVIVEAEHDCPGHDCPVCIQLQACLDGLQQTGMLPLSGDAAARADRTPFDLTDPPDFRASVLTLHAIDVRFDE